MDDIKILFDLPFQTLWVVAAGYVGYRLAYVGRDARHGQIDALLGTACFAAVSKAIGILLDGEMGEWIIPIIAVAGTALTALIWRRWAYPLCCWMLRETRFIDHDGQPNAWRTVLASSVKGPTQIEVTLKDGHILQSGDTSEFSNAPLKSCILGEDGSIGLYVTAEFDPETRQWSEVEAYNTEYPSWGYKMTFIPAAEVARVMLRNPK